MQKMSTLIAAFFAIFFHASETKETFNLCFVWWEEILQSVAIMKTILSNRLEENEKTI